MSKLLPRLFAVLFSIGCCSPVWTQLTIDATCENTTVQCLADLDAVTCPDSPAVFDAEGQEIGTADCLLVSERDNNRQLCTATTAHPNSGSNAGALVLYNIPGNMNSQYFVPTGAGLQLERFESGEAILSGTVAGVADPSEIWHIFIAYEGLTSDNDHVANGGGLKYDAGCAPVDTSTVEWDIYYMNNGLSYLQGAGSLDGSLLSLNHAPANQYFGFQVGAGGNDRNCNYGAGGWFSWSGTIKGEEVAGAMGDVLVDLACDPQEPKDGCDASVTCYCVGVDLDNNEFEVFTCTTQRLDDTPPTWVNPPADVTIQCTDEHPAVAVFTAQDNCEPGDEEIIDAVYQGEVIINPEGLNGCYTIERTWTAVDACDNDTAYTQVITVEDNEAPTWDDYEPYVMESCLVILDSTDAANPALVPITASDNCDPDLDYSIEAHEISGGCPTTWLRKWTATDDCGKSSVVVEQYVQLYDNTPPAMEAPANTTIYLDGDCNYDSDPAYTGLPTYSDHCSTQERLDSMLTYSDVDGAVTCTGDDDTPEGSFTITRTWSTKDFCGNENSDSHTIEVLDNISPVGTVLGAIIDCAAYDANTEYGSASGTDNCDTDVSYSWTTVTDRMDAGDDEEAPGCYYYDREYTFVDDCGNSSTEMQRIWLTDTTDPVLISAEVNRTVTCEAYNTNQGGILITAEDDCGDVTITFVDDTLSGGCVAPVGRFERTYTISDECGNSINFTQFLLLTDNTPPELLITCPNDTLLDSDEYCEVDLDPNALGYPSYNVTDNCQSSEDVYVTRTYVDGPVAQVCEGVYSFTRTWTVFALDPCYNHTSEVCTQEITVQDNIAPAAPGIDCPDHVILYVDENCEVNTMPGETGFADAITLDNCDSNPEIFVGYNDSPKEYTCEADAGSAFELDANLGALASASASFEDDLVAVGVSLDLEWAGSDCLEWPSDLTLVITSPNGDCATIAAVNSDGSDCDDYSYPASWNTQTAGNFILNFDLANELSGNGTWNLEVTNTWAGACGADFSLTATMIRRAEGSYTFTRTWSAYATDCAGNTSGTNTCTQTITVKDTIAPTIDDASPALIQISCDEFDESTVYGVTASDNCDSNVKVEVLYNEDCDGDLTHGFANDEVSGGCPGTYLRTYLATDDCNNTTTWTQTVQLFDDEAPSITIVCPGAANLSKDSGCGADDSIAGAGDATVTVLDNCDGDPTYTVATSDSEPDYSCPHSYSFTRTWTVNAEDECGNTSSASCSQLITVTDNSAPTPSISCPDDAMVYLDENCSVDLSTDALGAATASATDNCDDDVTVVVTHSDGAPTYSCSGDDSTLEGSYSFTRTFTATATDDCGNSHSVSCAQLITVIDNTAPSITLDDVHVIDCADYSAAGIYATAADNCDSHVTLELDDVVAESETDLEDCAGVYRHYYTATDDCGNSHSVSHLVQLVDSEAPQFDSFPADATAECGTSISSEVLGTPTFSDNCADDEDLTLSQSDTTVTEKDEDCRTINRYWTIEDPCGNKTTQIQVIVVEDSGMPTITVEAASDTVECDGEGNMDAFQAWLESYGGAQATDECTQDLIWDYEVPVISAGINPMLSDGCGATGEVTVTFYATDACGNSSPTTASFVIVDTQAPEINVTSLPDDALLTQNSTCNINTGVNITGVPTATAGEDDCCYAFVSISHSDGAPSGSCDGDDDTPEGSYSFIRTWTLYAYDECGNESDHVTHEQTITVIDNTVPQFTETCGYTNGQSIAVDCEDAFGGLDIPAACDVEATDNCDSDVTITCEVDTAGEFAPNGDIVMYSQASTPAAHLANGTTCSGMDPHAMRLISLPNSDEFYTLTGGGVAEHLASGEILLTAELSSSNPNLDAGWSLSLTLDPDEACGISHTGGQLISCDPEAALGLSLDDVAAWQYFILNCDESHLEGTGLYAGSHLELSHQPANGHYAFQLGAGANQQNGNFGLSGWFYYTGTFNDMNVMGSGDLFFDMDCCLPWSITHTCTAVDDCGNDNVFSYTFQMSGDVAGDDDSDLSGQGGSGDHTPVVIGGAGDLTTGKTPIRVTNLQPNPTNDISQLGFVVTENMRIRVDLIGMDGILVTELYDGIAQTGVNHTLDIDAEGLSGGMYQIRLTSNDYLVVKKLLVSE